MCGAIALVDALVVAVATRLGGRAATELERLRELKRAHGDALPQ